MISVAPASELSYYQCFFWSRRCKCWPPHMTRSTSKLLFSSIIYAEKATAWYWKRPLEDLIFQDCHQKLKRTCSPNHFSVAVCRSHLSASSCRVYCMDSTTGSADLASHLGTNGCLPTQGEPCSLLNTKEKRAMQPYSTGLCRKGTWWNVHCPLPHFRLWKNRICVFVMIHELPEELCTFKKTNQKQYSPNNYT